MCARYYYYEKPDAGDVFGSIMATLVIVGILLYLAICISFYILMVFCGIGVLIGTVYALVVYLKSFFFVCRRVWYSSAGGNRLLGILTKWLVIIKDTSISAFCENFRTAGKAFSNAGMYRFLSFRKWMWLIVAPTVTVLGTLLILAVIFLHVLFFVFLVQLALSILAAILVFLLAIALVYSVVATVVNYIRSIQSRGSLIGAWEFSRSSTFGEIFPVYSVQHFQTLFGRVIDVFSNGWSQGVTNFTSIGGYGYVSFWRYFLLASPVGLLITAALFAVVYTPIALVLYLPMLLVNTLWVCIAKIAF